MVGPETAEEYGPAPLWPAMKICDDFQRFQIFSRELFSRWVARLGIPSEILEEDSRPRNHKGQEALRNERIDGTVDEKGEAARPLDDPE
jgi:hypothetical protein